MSAAQRLSRLLTLVPWLLAHDGVTIDEAAHHFGVTAEVLEQDLWLLVVSGLPGYGPDQLVDIDFWDDGIIQVIDPQILDRPMRLTPDEAFVLLVALRTLAQVPGIVDRSAILSASAKVEMALDEAHRASDLPEVDLGTTEQIRSAIDEAMAADRALTLVYATASREEVTHRTVLPHRIRVVDGIGYLEAWCMLAGAVRTFRLDRIIEATVVDRGESVPAGESSSGDASDGPPPTVAARLSVAPSARWIIDVHRTIRVIGERDDGSVVVELPLQSVDWGVRLVLSLGGAATALEPPELVTAIGQTAAAALAEYGHHVG